MNLDPSTCHRALSARDTRFDGVFFVAVRSTRIYCRPVCPARTPGLDRCGFYPSAAAAERAGFRPCLRCRPELAPGLAPIDAADRLARRAAVRIGETIGDERGLDELAAELGVGPRHLRRVVRRRLGVAPVELAQTHRLLLAKQLLTETRLPITQVAFSAGFGSVRRFNAVFRQRYRLTPSDLRRTGPRTVPDGAIRLTLAYRPPLAWDELLGFLAARAMTGVEAVAGQTYLCTVAVGDHRGWLRVEPIPGRDALAVELPVGLAGALPLILPRLRNLFDLDARPGVIDEHLGCDPILAPSVRDHPGLRVPGSFDGFELAVRLILGQQVSVRGATTLTGRFAAAFGEPIETPFASLTRLGPQPARVADAPPDDLIRIGLPAARARCIQALARAACDGAVRLEPGADPEAAIEQFQALPGIGPWTAHAIAMRGLRWPDAFPDADLGLRAALGGGPARAILDRAEAWRPWRAYAAIHLWHGRALARPATSTVREQQTSGALP